MEITFTAPKDIVVVSEMKRTIDKIVITDVIDSPQRKTVVAMTMELGSIMLWEGTAYDAIGQWTDADVINRINEIYK
jgi:hypothetical protein